MSSYQVSFPGSPFESVEVPLADELSEHLNATNSPVLFGCRTGICGTCLCRAKGAFPPANAEEHEALQAHAPGDPEARLACQLLPEGDIELRAIEV